MARIITLNRDLEAPQAASDALDDEAKTSAEVILFPGVRYERWAQTADRAKFGKSDLHGMSDLRALRDWLEI